MKALFVFLLLAIASCNTEIQEPELEFDVSGLIKCITDVAPLVPDVVEIINYIKAADWAHAANKVFDTIRRGIPVAKGCIAAFKKEVSLEAKINGRDAARIALCIANCAVIQPNAVLKALCVANCR